MRNTLVRTVSLLLALLLGLSGCGKTRRSAPEELPAMATAAPTAEPTAAPSPSPEAEELSGALDGTGWPSADGIHADVDFADMHWYLYDMSEFESRARELSETEDADWAEALYSWLETEYNRIQTLDELAWIEFYAGGGPEAAERCRICDEMLTTAGDRLYSAASQALSGAAGEGFSQWMGEEDSLALEGYEEMTDRELEIQTRETELQLQYNDLMQRQDLSPKELAAEAGAVFLELVALRNELAAIYGYDSFADYAYEAYYGRDFTPGDAAGLCEAVHPYARSYFADCCYCGAFYARLGKAAVWDREELIGLLRDYAPRISPQAESAERYMEEHGLYLLGYEEDIADMGFTATLNYYNAPFLYNCLLDSVTDPMDTVHEFGHYYEAWLHPEVDPLGSGGSFDIFEIHSTGLEALFYSWYEEIFGNRAEEARIHCLDKLIYNVVSGCMYDEFQRYAYDHPELSVEELCDAYAELRRVYGDEIWSEDGRYDWIYVSHTFESPFYYISYAASALASLQLWSLSQEDFDGAVELYNRLVEMGACDLPYCQLVREAGLTLFTEDLEACMGEPLRALRRMCLSYDGYPLPEDLAA